MDIVGSLPPELLIQVVEYLDPADIVRAQGVSKRWRSIFSSNTIITFALRQTLGFLNIKGMNVSASDAMKYFRWQYGLQCGRPVRKSFLSWPSDLAERPAEVCYSSARLCYRFHTNNVQILDLRTGKISIWTEEDAGDIADWEIRVSDSFVVLLTGSTKRYLIAWDIHTSERYEAVVPYYRHDTSLVKDKVISVGYEAAPLYRIYIWDLSSNWMREVTSLANLWLWHVDADENILVTFQIDWDTEPAKVQQTKWTFTGSLLNRKHFCLPLPGRRVDKKNLKTFLKFSSHTHDHVTVRRLVTDRDGNNTVDLMYDYAVDKLSVRWNDCIQPSIDYSASLFYSLLTPHMAYNWNWRQRRLELFNAKDQTTSMHSYILHHREDRVRWWFEDPYPSDEADDEEPFFLPFGDREVFGMASSDGVQFWFFNPNFAPDLPGMKPFRAMEES